MIKVLITGYRHSGTTMLMQLLRAFAYKNKDVNVKADYNKIIKTLKHKL
jgi:hypothetical protein